MQKPEMYTRGIVVVGVLAVFIAMISGGNAMVFINWESFLITVLGSFAALMINYSLDDAMQVMRDARTLFKTKAADPYETIESFGVLATRARREGLLVLEDEIPELEPFLGKGLQMMIDGYEPDAVQNVLQREIGQLEAQHGTGVALLTTWSGLAPGFGMIGTLVGLVKMLANLDDPSTIGPAMAIALVTTLYGALMANFLLTPLAGKVSHESQRSVLYREMIVEGLTALQAGTNPRVIERRLQAFVVSAKRERREVVADAADD